MTRFWRSCYIWIVVATPAAPKINRSQVDCPWVNCSVPMYGKGEFVEYGMIDFGADCPDKTSGIRSRFAIRDIVDFQYVFTVF